MLEFHPICSSSDNYQLHHKHTSQKGSHTYLTHVWLPTDSSAPASKTFPKNSYHQVLDCFWSSPHKSKRKNHHRDPQTNSSPQVCYLLSVCKIRLGKAFLVFELGSPMKTDIRVLFRRWWWILTLLTAILSSVEWIMITNTITTNSRVPTSTRRAFSKELRCFHMLVLVVYRMWVALLLMPARKDFYLLYACF